MKKYTNYVTGFLGILILFCMSGSGFAFSVQKLYNSYSLDKIKYSKYVCANEEKYNRCQSSIISSVFWIDDELERIGREKGDIFVSEILVEEKEYAIIFPYLFKKNCIQIKYCKIKDL